MASLSVPPINNNGNVADWLNDSHGALQLLTYLPDEEENSDNERCKKFKASVRRFKSCKGHNAFAKWVVDEFNAVEKDPIATIPLIRFLQDIRSKNPKNTIPGHLSRVAFEKMLHLIPTIKYRLHNILGVDDLLYDKNEAVIFYDGGRDAKMGTLKAMSKEAETNDREVLIIDSRFPIGLEKHLACAKEAIRDCADLKDRIQGVAKYVCAAMGGTNVDEAEAEQHIRELRKSKKFETDVGEVLLGTIELGLCRHRAILFKWLCDHKELNIQTCLVRGKVNFNGGDGFKAHAWNICVVKQENHEETQKEYLVDVMNIKSGILLPNEEADAWNYKQTGGIGGVVNGGVTHTSVRRLDDLNPINYTKTPNTKNGQFIDEGTYGKVYKVRSKANDSMWYALKILKKVGGTSSINANYLKEINILLRVNHSNIIKLIWAFEDKDRDSTEEHPATNVHILLEYAGGHTLRHNIETQKEKGKLIDTDQLSFWLHHIALGMAYLHKPVVRRFGEESRIIHRDLKPENILICDGIAKIADFGVSKFLPQNASSATMTLIGTTKYMAPECNNPNWAQHASHKVDVWSYGIIIGYCLSGKEPEERDVPLQEKIYKEEDLKGGNFSDSIKINELHKKLKKLYTKCIGNVAYTDENCKQNIEKRPEFKDIEQEIQEMLVSSKKRARNDESNESYDIDKIINHYKEANPGCLPFVVACEEGKYDHIRCMVEHQCKPSGGRTCHTPAISKKVRIFLQKKGKSSILSRIQVTGLIAAVAQDKSKVVEYLLSLDGKVHGGKVEKLIQLDEHQDSVKKQNALHYACSECNENTVILEMLLEFMKTNNYSKEFINKQNGYGSTALDLAENFFKNDDAGKAVKAKKIKLIKDAGGIRSTDLEL